MAPDRLKYSIPPLFSVFGASRHALLPWFPPISRQSWVGVPDGWRAVWVADIERLVLEPAAEEGISIEETLMLSIDIVRAQTHPAVPSDHDDNGAVVVPPGGSGPDCQPGPQHRRTNKVQGHGRLTVLAV